MDKHARRNCTFCRLANCFSVGMSSDLIRKEETKPTKLATANKIKTHKRTADKQKEVCIRTE